MSSKLDMTKKYHTQDNDYTLDFGSVLNSHGIVRFIDRSRSKESTIGITVDDTAFKYRVQREFPSIVADLIDVAVAIHASDRLALQHLHQDQSRIYVVLPVRHPEVFKAVRSKLENLLEYTTGSRWIFDFQRRVDPERSVVQQLSLSVVPEGCEVALWSGGLDAFAGLYTRLRTYPEKSFVLFGTGSNDSVYAKQGEVAKQIESIFPRRSHLYRVPIRFHYSKAHQKNKITRARGVVFTLLGSVCAHLMGRQELCVYENGIGAINLPYRGSAVGLDHSRSVHPLTLLMVSDIISELLGEEFRVWNPFLFWTKAQMCQALAADGRSDLTSKTKSCDRPHHQQPIQCGYCSSCILRRQALAASQIKDKTRYVILHGKQPATDPRVYFRHMLAQVHTLKSLLNASDSPALQWESLAYKFPVLDEIVDRCSPIENLSIPDIRSRLLQLYRTYITEWNGAEFQLSVGLLNSINQQPLGKQKYKSIA